uniref:SSD domain-containing protein n=1 Tax=Acrobeloides nanus TaxID=290746 RepID=A0A914CBG1_9BILA
MEKQTDFQLCQNHDNWKPDPKCAKFLNLWSKFSLGHLFGILGKFIGTYPLAFFIVALVMTSTSLGMYKLKLQDRLRDGYTPTNSLSRYESDVYREFLGLTDDPIVTVALFLAKDGGSMHRPEYLDEVIELHKYLRSNLSCDYSGPENGHPKVVKYADICGPFCDANVVIEYFAETIKDELKRANMGQSKSFSVNLTYPITTVRGFPLHLERNFFGVKMVEPNISNVTDSLETDEVLQQLNRITPIRYVEAIMMIFRGEGHEQKMAQWEMALYKFSQENFTSDLLHIIVLGSGIVDYEMNRDSQKTVPYFAVGFSSMLGFVFATVLISSYYYGVFDYAKIIVALATTLCPILAITSTFGILSIIRMRTNTIMMIMPFLIMGIGVNDAFLMIHAWHRTAKHGIKEVNRLSLVLEEVGPSITITTLTNVITFSIGSFTPTPEIQLFCTATAIALGLAYFYCLVLFVPVLYLASAYENKCVQTSSKKASKLKDALSTCCQVYSKIIRHRFSNYVLLVGVFIYWYFSIFGTMILKSKLDTEKIIPPNNPLRAPNEIFMRVVYQDYYPVTVFVNNPLDIRNKTSLDKFYEMLNEFEGMKLCRGKELTILWLRDYIEYINTYEDFDYYSENGVPASSLEVTNNSETGVDYKRLKEFLASPIYKYYRSFMKLNDTNPDLPLSKFMFIITYHNTTSWDDRIDIVQKSRDIASRYLEMNVTIWEANAMFVDQMLSLKTITLLTCLMTLGCMAIVCAIFIQNPLAVVTATSAILSIGLGVIGFLSLWNLDLDPATMCAVLMSIGMSVDFTAHVAYNFQLTERSKIKDGKVVKISLKSQQDKLINTLQAVAWPMLQGGFSTVLTIVPLALLQDYIPLVFVKTIVLVVTWGLLHGLVLLPAFLVFLPKKWLEMNCYRYLSRKIAKTSENNNNEAKASANF